MLITLCIAGSVIAIGMIWRGHMPRRTGDTPFCKPCGYNLTGLTSDRCPECGRLITDDNIVRGTRRRRPVLTASGAVVLGVCAGLMIVHWLSLDWSRYKPTFWLMSDLQASKRLFAQRAIRELNRRFAGGELSRATQSRLADFCLKQQTLEPPSPICGDLMSTLGSMYSSGLLSDAQVNLMFSQALKCEVQVRPRLVVGEDLPLKLNCRLCGPVLPSGGNLSLRINTLEVQLNNGPRIKLGSGYCGMASPGCWLGIHRVIASEQWPAGKHLLSVKANASLYTGSYSTSTRPDHEEELVITTPVEFLPAEPEGGLVRGVRDDAIKQNLKNLFRIERLEYRNRSLLGTISVNVHEALWPRGPVPVAFDLIARVDGREIALNATMARLLKPHTSHSSDFHSTHELDLPPSATCDIILRGSEKAARQTIDLDEYWVGELIFTNLPIAGLDSGDSRQTSQPVGSVPGETRTDD